MWGTWKNPAGSAWESKDMFMLGLRAAEKGIRAAVKSAATHVDAYVDNQGVQYALKKEHCALRRKSGWTGYHLGGYTPPLLTGIISRQPEKRQSSTEVI